MNLAENHGRLTRLGENLLRFLRNEFDSPKLQLAQPLSPLAGGYENTICGLQLTNGPAFLSRALVLRVFSKNRKPSNLRWESILHETLNRPDFPVPKIHCICADTSILGSEFLLMDCVPGKQLITEPVVRMHELLAETHAKLHAIPIQPIREKLKSLKISDNQFGIAYRLNWLRELANKNPSLNKLVQWLADNRPAESDALSVCHIDFHGFNVLVDNHQVSGILDWSDAIIADPAYDVANTMMLLTIPGKHLAADWQHLLDPNSPTMNPEEMADIYLQRYLSLRPLDLSRFTYYRVLRCAVALSLKIYQVPALLADLERYILEQTDIAINRASIQFDI